jgi:hypothetical protein
VLWAVLLTMNHEGGLGDLDFGWWIETGNVVLLWAMQAMLAGRAEWVWNGWLPVGMERRRQTRGERRTQRVDWELSWRARGGVSLSPACSSLCCMD